MRKGTGNNIVMRQNNALYEVEIPP